jgi:hypothetical protein
VRRRWITLATTLAVVSSSLVLGYTAAQADNPAPPDPVLFAAGDVAKPGTTYAQATSDIIMNGINQNPDRTRVAMLGDGAYPGGAVSDYDNYYKPSWGRFYDKTLPTPGNHDYGQQATAHAPGYTSYFGPLLSRLDPTGVASDETKGWYSYDLGAWHIISLNWWACSVQLGNNCGPNSPQAQWLAADLAKTQAKCMIAMWHSATFFSGNTDESGNTHPTNNDINKTDTFWKMLQNAGADIVLAGHQHNYERFAKVTPDTANKMGVPDPNGMREFVVGTGGGGPSTFLDPAHPTTGSEMALDHVYGVLKLTLHDTSYDWQFIDTTGAVRDQSTQPEPCRSDIPTTSTQPTATTGPTGTTAPTTATTAPGTHPNAAGSGYWMVGADGKVFNFGDAKNYGSASVPAGAEATKLAPTPSGKGYWVVDSTGGVSPFGDAKYLGGPDSFTLTPGEKVTSISATPTGAGYWIFTSRGRVLNYGDAVHYGDMSKTKLNGPVLDSIPTPSGRGYYMVASDGGIFAFGDAQFYGSMGNKKLNAPVRSLVPDADGVGYWLVASDGGIFAFDAPFRGSMGSTRLNRPITGMVRFGSGYLMVGEDGGIFNFSDRDFYGSLGANPPPRPIVSVAAFGG